MSESRSIAGHVGSGAALSRRAKLYATRKSNSIVRLAMKPARIARESESTTV